MPDEPQLSVDGAPSKAAPYRVLARKYRPNRFSELIGQEPLVRTLRNAIEQGRLAHAFILSGVRGVGKTTTARLIAKALNCTGPDGTSGPAQDPCGTCDSCLAIAESRHVDVIEMDAASRTGVDDIREIIDGVRYAPSSARYKVYIIDEVHMLSRNAFNALLKTLEEPPDHVIFIFATTEIRKVPVTVLSRCQRFDLRRVDAATLAAHLTNIAESEGVKAEPEAIAMIARAAEGSVRDGLSILDQVIAHGGAEVLADQIRDLLGLADRQTTFELFDAIMSGDVPRALEIVRRQYDGGTDPVVILQDLMDVTHWVTQLKMVPDAADEQGVPEAERDYGKRFAQKLGMAHLTRAWQMLLKGLDETLRAPSPIAAVEMALIRLAYAGKLPTPAEVLDTLESGKASPAHTRPAPTQQTQSDAGSSNAPSGPAAVRAVAAPTQAPMSTGGSAPQAALETAPTTLQSFEQVVALAGENNALRLQANLVDNVHLVRFQPGRIELRLGEKAPVSLPSELSAKLSEWTDTRWIVSLSSEKGQPSLKAQKDTAQADLENEIKNDPLVKSALSVFPDARITDIKTLSEEGLSSPEPDEIIE